MEESDVECSIRDVRFGWGYACSYMLICKNVTTHPPKFPPVETGIHFAILNSKLCTKTSLTAVIVPETFLIA